MIKTENFNFINTYHQPAWLENEHGSFITSNVAFQQFLSANPFKDILIDNFSLNSHYVKISARSYDKSFIVYWLQKKSYSRLFQSLVNHDGITYILHRIEPWNFLEELRKTILHSQSECALFDIRVNYLAASKTWKDAYDITYDINGKNHYEVFPEITDEWRQLHQECLRGKTLARTNDVFERQDGSIQYLSWIIRPWYTGGYVSGIIMLSEKRDLPFTQNLDQLPEDSVTYRLSKLPGNLLDDHEDIKQYLSNLHILNLVNKPAKVSKHMDKLSKFGYDV